MQGPPQELEIKDGAVVTHKFLHRGTKYGPYTVKYTDQPVDRQFAWEVSQSFFFLYFLIPLPPTLNTPLNIINLTHKIFYENRTISLSYFPFNIIISSLNNIYALINIHHYVILNVTSQKKDQSFDKKKIQKKV